MGKLLCAAILLHLLSFHCHVFRAQEEPLDYPSADAPTSWRISAPERNVTFTDGTQVRPILLRRNRSGMGMTFACGFFCRGSCSSFIFAVFMVSTNSGGGIVLPTVGIPQVVWAANRARPVQESATLELTSDGDLVLSDADGSKVWSSGTAGKSVAGMNITESGNLVLFGGNNQTILWESFSSPTDSLVPGQKLRLGQTLTSNVSAGNSSEGLYSLLANSTGLIAFVNSNPPARYAFYDLPAAGFFEFRKGSFFADSSEPSLPPSQYLRLESDGSLRVYAWDSSSPGWAAGVDLLNAAVSSCFSPTACGRYGVCSGKDHCACPRPAAGHDSFFRPADGRNPAAGCSEIAPLSCSGPHNHSFLQLDEVSYFGYFLDPADLESVDRSSCREACKGNCSCRAGFFVSSVNASEGSCYLRSEVFSLKNNEPEVSHYSSTAFLKVQIPLVNGGGMPTGGENGGGTRTGVIVGAALGGLFGLLVLSGCGIFVAKKRAAAIRRKKDEERKKWGTIWSTWRACRGGFLWESCELRRTTFPRSSAREASGPCSRGR